MFSVSVTASLASKQTVPESIPTVVTESRFIVPRGFLEIYIFPVVTDNLMGLLIIQWIFKESLMVIGSRIDLVTSVNRKSSILAIGTFICSA